MRNNIQSLVKIVWEMNLKISRSKHQKYFWEPKPCWCWQWFFLTKIQKVIFLQKDWTIFLLQNQHNTRYKQTRKLDQVYYAWLIKWVVKWEFFKLTELCLSGWFIISGTWWYWVSIWWYWLVLDQYKLVLFDIRWYRVSKGLVCLYILEKVEIWSGVTDASHTQPLTDNRI